MNVLHNSAIKECTSCQMCGAVCHSNAISIHLDNDGFYRPYIEDDKCTDCGQCVNVCYKFDKIIPKTSDTELDQSITLYAATAKDNEIVSNTTSGGIADLFAKQLIEDGYKVIGVAYDYTTNRAKHQIATTIEETIPFRGSKYIQSYSMDAFRELVKECSKQPFAIFGLPCQIYATSKYLNKKGVRKQCILLDLYCHGCPTMHLWDKNIAHFQKKMGTDKFDNVCFRSKIKGWGNFVVEVKQGKRSYHSMPLHNEFFDLFFSDQVLNVSCSNCELRSTLSYTDIRLGDFWGKQYKKNFRGVSGVTLVSDNAKVLFSKIIPYIDYKKESFSSFLPYQSWGKTYTINPSLRNKLMKFLNDKDKNIDETIEPILERRTFKRKAIVLFKQILFNFPPRLYFATRRLLSIVFLKVTEKSHNNTNNSTKILF
ncbi:MAG: Coenzyme F420 hydrogenase/dehydrogenase, beta subunit C-terminal domain [Prevotella sp.]|nr:Coenzyme F420 hydrogenase/dehydrogenase, beta subunit C-terminal domain [Prevotella sp.]